MIALLQNFPALPVRKSVLEDTEPSKLQACPALVNANALEAMHVTAGIHADVIFRARASHSIANAILYPS
jgi:hypothetical protein